MALPLRVCAVLVENLSLVLALTLVSSKPAIPSSGTSMPDFLRSCVPAHMYTYTQRHLNKNKS